MDTPAPALEGPGIDYGHLALTDVQAEATDIAYIVDSLHLRLRQLSGVEKSGLVLEKTEGEVIYDPRFLGLNNFELRTANTLIESENTTVEYDFAGGDIEDMIAKLQLNGHIGLRDVAYLAPDLLEIPVVGTNLGQRVRFTARANGTMAVMDINSLQLDGPGIKVRATGHVENAADPDNIAGRLNLAELSITPKPLLPLVPAGMLPPDIDWPDKIIAEGRAEYRNDKLNLNLYAVENRQSGSGLQSRVKTNGVIDGVTAFPSTRLDVDLDTLLATRATILAYVPPGSLPEDYTLPDYVRGSGTVTGPMDDLDVDLRLALPGDSTYASINGNIQNALDPDNLNLDLQVKDLAVNIGDVSAILPDSLLPANLNLPNLRIQNASISGSLDNLVFDIPLETDNGTWRIDGKYNPQDLAVNVDIDGVVLPTLFTGALGDTLANLDLGPIDITANVTGQLEPAMDLDVAATIGDDAGQQWVDFVAEVGDNRYAADFEFTHPEFLAVGEGLYAIGADSVAQVEALVDVNRLNMEYWELTQVPMLVEGRVQADANGLDPYNMEAVARLDSVALRGAEGSSYVDSLLVTASLQNKNNEVYVYSDVLEAELLGRFDPLKTPEKMVDFIMAYWDDSVAQPNPVENGEELDFVLTLKRPQPLTGGLINGLNALSPFTASLLYRDATPSLLVNLDVEEIDYAGLTAHDLDFQVIGDTADLAYEAHWSDIELNEQFALGRTTLSGETTGEAVTLELQLYSEEDSLRHYLGLLIDPESDTMSIKFDPEQILNFETWTVPVDNEILIATAGPSLLINNLVLQNGEQVLAAKTTEPNNALIRFEDFRLNTPSRLLYSEKEFIGGIVNGEVELDNVLTNLGIQSDLKIDNFKYEGVKVADIDAQVNSSDEQTYNVDVSLSDAGNDARITGQVVLNGPLDINVDLTKLQLSSVEPFSIGYLQNTEGYLTGNIDVGGTLDSPSFDGQMSFADASIVISLLGERFALDSQPIRFSGKTITFPSGWSIKDSEGGAARVQGEVVMQTLSDILLDLNIEAKDFLAINSTEEQNEDYYGSMYVDATVDITGTALLPVVDVEASTSRESDVTYVYRVPDEGLVEAEGIVDFVEQYRWQDILRRDTLADDTMDIVRAGLDLTLELRVDPELEVTVVVDPVQGQTFVGRAVGDLTMQIFPDGRQEATGRVELVEGEYDYIYQGIINKKFQVLEGSSVVFNGEIENPQMDFRIRHIAETSGLPLVQGLQGAGAGGDVAGLRREQTFYLDITLKGDLQASQLTTNVVYPEDAYGNLGLNEISTSALATYRQDDSRMTSLAFQLLAFGSFNVPIVEQGAGGGGSLAANTLTGFMDTYLNNFADQLVGFVDLDFGFDNYEDESGKTQTNLRVSLRKTLFDDRVVISVDGVAGTSEDELAGTQQTYLDNITAEYLINEDGTFRLKLFNDRDRSTLVGGNVIRFGGRLTFSKDFDRLGWFKNDSK